MSTQKAVEQQLANIHPNELKKHAAIVHTSGQLTLLERKLVNVLLLNAYNDLPTSSSHAIPVRFLCAMVGWDDSHDFAHLKKALKRIVGTPLELNVLGNAGKERWSATSLLASAEIEDGVCTYEYSRRMAELLYSPEMYAVINIAVQKEFKGGYALTLYENCVRFKNLGQTPSFEIGRLRKLLGADAPMYDDFRRFSAFVIKKAVTDINATKGVDIHVRAEYTRVERKVTSVQFFIEKTDPEKDKQQTLLPIDGNFDGSEQLKKSAAYERLRSHGISELLSLQWMKQEPERVQTVLNEVDKRNKNIKSKSGYIVKAMIDKYELGPTPYEKQKAKQTQIAIDSQESDAIQEKIESEKTKALANIIQSLSQDTKKTIIELAYSDNAIMLSKLLEKNDRGSIMVSEYRALAVLCKKKNINPEVI
jgi:hypothetical protein